MYDTINNINNYMPLLYHNKDTGRPPYQVNRFHTPPVGHTTRSWPNRQKPPHNKIFVVAVLIEQKLPFWHYIKHKHKEVVLVPLTAFL